MQQNICRNIVSSPSNHSFRRNQSSTQFKIEQLQRFNCELSLRNQNQLQRVRQKWKCNGDLRAQLQLLKKKVLNEEKELARQKSKTNQQSNRRKSNQSHNEPLQQISVLRNKFDELLHLSMRVSGGERISARLQMSNLALRIRQIQERNCMND